MKIHYYILKNWRKNLEKNKYICLSLLFLLIFLILNLFFKYQLNVYFKNTYSVNEINDLDDGYNINFNNAILKR